MEFEVERNRTAQLAAVLLERHRFDEARACFDRYGELTPLADRETSQWLAARRADLAYESGDLAEGSSTRGCCRRRRQHLSAGERIALRAHPFARLHRVGQPDSRQHPVPERARPQFLHH